MHADIRVLKRLNREVLSLIKVTFKYNLSNNFVTSHYYLLVKRKLEHSQGCQKQPAAGANHLKLSDNPDSINQTNCLHPCTRRVLNVDSRRNNLSERGKGEGENLHFSPFPFPVFHKTHSWLPQTRDHRLLFRLVKTSGPSCLKAD